MRLPALKGKMRLETVIFEKMLALKAKGRYYFRFGIRSLVYRSILREGWLKAGEAKESVLLFTKYYPLTTINLGDKSVKTEILDAVESKSLKDKIPHFEIGDIVEVHCRIKEGDKERTQVFSGTVIARKGRGINENFTVRRMVGNEGVERIFPLNSPNVLDIKPIRSGKTRRAKLYYLRDRTGKSVRLKQRHSDHTISR
jgi:large subunit ribosomal protein L19